MKLAVFLEKIDALTPRERVILFLLLLAGLWAGLDGLLLRPMNAALHAQDKALLVATDRIAKARDVLSHRAGQIDPARLALQRLENARQALYSRMHAHTQGRLVAARDMPQVLQGLLRNQPGLRLASLATLRPEPVGLPELAKPEDAALFRQGVRISLVGGFEPLVRYMESLEKLPTGFYWARAELDARHRPEIELTLTLYTLSMEQTWLTM